MLFRRKKAKANIQVNTSESRPRPFVHHASFASVLVEDDERVRRFWEEYFCERAMRIYVLETEESFLEFYHSINFPIQFYFDQDFGMERGVGVRLAKIVKDSCHRISTNLITAYFPEDFRSELQDGVLDSVLPKYPSQIFGPNYFKMRMKQEIRERGAETIIDESFKKIADALKPFDRSESRESSECRS